MVFYVCVPALMRWGGGAEKNLISSGEAQKIFKEKKIKIPIAPPPHPPQPINYEWSLMYLSM